MSNYPNIAHRVFNKPHLVEPQYGRVFISALAERLEIRSITLPDGTEMSRRQMRRAAQGYGGHQQTVFDQVDGIAVIPVEGTLVHRFGHLDPYSGMTGYDGIQAKVDAALADPNVRGILMDIDSPGGEVSGCFDLTDYIYQARQAKPIWALADELACSAAFSIASACSRIIAPRTARIGSVGVLTAHVDQSQMLKKAGLDVTLIFAGDHKVDGNPYEPLPASVRDEIQAEIDQLYGMFVRTVARNRGMSEQAVRDTQARVYSTGEAEGVGFADETMAARDVLAAFDEHLRGPRGTISMQSPEVDRMAILGLGRKAKADKQARADHRAKLEAELAALEAEEAEEADPEASGETPPAADPEGGSGEETPLSNDSGDRAGEEPAGDDVPQEKAAASLSELVDMCATANCDRLAKSMHEQGATVAEAQAVMADVKAIRDAFAAAFPDDKQAAAGMAERFVDAAHTGRFAGAARALLTEVTAAASSEEVDHHQPEGSQQASTGLSPTRIYGRMNERK